ncbi:GNAT family N-acetyltransferase [Patescibacteria group bacterium]|nr:GNAT family N-acetyltransferase [Patescibacteria group bacterium]
MEKEHRERPKFTIERAVEADVPSIASIGRKLKIDVVNPDPAIIGKGFLVYALPPEGYSRRLNPHFTVAKEGDTLLGYLMCYDNVLLTQLIADGSIGHEDGITNFITSQEPTDRFVYGDQIGIDYENHRTGIGSGLMQQNFEHMREEGIRKMYVAILHQPLKNEASISFCTRLGATCVGEVQNRDGIMLGIYRFEIEGAKE